MAKPDRLGPAGTKLWDDLNARLEFDAHEELVLGEACRVADGLADLNVVIEHGLVVLASGEPNPALVEARMQAIALTRLLASLRLPDDLEDVEHRPAASRSPRRLPQGCVVRRRHPEGTRGPTLYAALGVLHYRSLRDRLDDGARFDDGQVALDRAVAAALTAHELALVREVVDGASPRRVLGPEPSVGAVELASVSLIGRVGVRWRDGGWAVIVPPR